MAKFGILKRQREKARDEHVLERRARSVVQATYVSVSGDRVFKRIDHVKQNDNGLRRPSAPKRNIEPVRKATSENVGRALASGNAVHQVQNAEFMSDFWSWLVGDAEEQPNSGAGHVQCEEPNSDECPTKEETPTEIKSISPPAFKKKSKRSSLPSSIILRPPVAQNVAHSTSSHQSSAKLESVPPIMYKPSSSTCRVHQKDYNLPHRHRSNASMKMQPGSGVSRCTSKYYSSVPVSRRPQLILPRSPSTISRISNPAEKKTVVDDSKAKKRAIRIPPQRFMPPTAGSVTKTPPTGSMPLPRGAPSPLNLSRLPPRSALSATPTMAKLTLTPQAPMSDQQWEGNLESRIPAADGKEARSAPEAPTTEKDSRPEQESVPALAGQSQLEEGSQKNERRNFPLSWLFHHGEVEKVEKVDTEPVSTVEVHEQDAEPSPAAVESTQARNDDATSSIEERHSRAAVPSSCVTVPFLCYEKEVETDDCSTTSTELTRSDSSSSNDESSDDSSFDDESTVSDGKQYRLTISCAPPSWIR